MNLSALALQIAGNPIFLKPGQVAQGPQGWVEAGERAVRAYPRETGRAGGVLTRLQFVQMCKSACGLCKGAKVRDESIEYGVLSIGGCPVSGGRWQPQVAGGSLRWQVAASGGRWREDFREVGAGPRTALVAFLRPQPPTANHEHLNQVGARGTRALGFGE